MKRWLVINRVPNKNIMVGILLAEKALLKSPYVKRYVARRVMSFTNTWKQISDELLAAYNLLPSTIQESDFGYSKGDFLQYLSVNELRLAMEELDGVMENNTNPGTLFWEHMIKAASLMNRIEHVEKYKQFRIAT